VEREAGGWSVANVMFDIKFDTVCGSGVGLASLTSGSFAPAMPKRAAQAKKMKARPCAISVHIHDVAASESVAYKTRSCD